MCMLQTIYDNRFVPHIGVGIEWLVERIVIRESSHTPYRFMLGYSRVRNAQEENDIYKELVLSGRIKQFFIYKAYSGQIKQGTLYYTTISTATVSK